MTCEHSFSIWFAGAETTHWRQLLTDEGAEHVALNFRELKLTTTKPYLLSERYDPRLEILVDSGAYGAKTQNNEHQNELYTDWVDQNVDRLTLVTEYDAGDLEWIKANRAAYWDQIDPAKFMPIWHEEHGPAELDELCRRYQRVGIVRPSRNLESKLRALTATTGVKLHGAGITKHEDMTRVPYTSVSSTSWISPTKWGDVQVWSGSRWHWYPAKNKDEARRRHYNDFERAGFNADAIVDGDNTEISRYTISAWRHYETSVARKRRGNVVAIRPEVDPRQDPPVGSGAVVTSTPNLPAKRESKQLFPGFATSYQRVENPQPGQPEVVSVIRRTDAGMRQCNTCVLARTCPAFQPDTECSFHMPVQIKSREQLRASLLVMLEVQMERTMFARLNEEAEGGPGDPMVSAEIDRYFGLVKLLRDIETDSSFLRIEVKGQGQPGILSQLLGAHLGEQGQAAARVARTQNSVIDPDQADRLLQDVLDVDPEPDHDR